MNALHSRNLSIRVSAKGFLFKGEHSSFYPNVIITLWREGEDALSQGTQSIPFAYGGSIHNEFLNNIYKNQT